MGSALSVLACPDSRTMNNGHKCWVYSEDKEREKKEWNGIPGAFLLMFESSLLYAICQLLPSLPERRNYLSLVQVTHQGR